MFLHRQFLNVPLPSFMASGAHHWQQQTFKFYSKPDLEFQKIYQKCHVCDRHTNNAAIQHTPVKKEVPKPKPLRKANDLISLEQVHIEA